MPTSIRSESPWPGKIWIPWHANLRPHSHPNVCDQPSIRLMINCWPVLQATVSGISDPSRVEYANDRQSHSVVFVAVVVGLEQKIQRLKPSFTFSSHPRYCCFFVVVVVRRRHWSSSVVIGRHRCPSLLIVDIVCRRCCRSLLLLLRLLLLIIFVVVVVIHRCCCSSLLLLVVVDVGHCWWMCPDISDAVVEVRLL